MKIPKRFILIPFLANFIACTVIEAAPVTYIVVTANPVDVGLGGAAQATATASRSKLDPEKILQLAKNRSVNGYYDEAIALYREILSMPMDSVEVPLRAEAAFSLGQLAMQSDEFADASAVLSLFIEEFPTDERRPQAHYLRGDAAAALGQWKLAIVDYQEYIARGNNLLASYSWEKIADAYRNMGEHSKAIQHYLLALQHPRSLIPTLILREKLAEIHSQAGEYSMAVAQYEEILSVARNAPYRAEMEYYAAQATLEGGNLKNGLERMLAITRQYPETFYAHLALQALDVHQMEIAADDRALIQFHYGDYASVLATIESLSSKQALTTEQYLMKGRSQRALEDFAGAQLTFQIAAALNVESPLFGESLLEQGRTHFLEGRIQDAINRYLTIAETHPHLEATAAEALWRAGYLYGTGGATEKSREVFLELAERYPNSEPAESGLSLAAAAAVQNDDDISAAAIFKLLTESENASTSASAWFWLAAHPEVAGGMERERAFAQITNQAPDGFYAARVADINMGRPPFSPPANYQFSFDELSEREAAEKWLRGRFSLQQDGTLWPLSAALQNDARLLRGQEMWVLGAFDEAIDEFFALVNAHQSNALNSYQLAIHLRDLTAFYPSIVAAANVIKLANTSTLAAPPYLARLRYPSYFLQPLLDSSRRHEVDPLLLLSLVRHESLFNARATAGAGEKGLTQVIPSTGDYIASQLSWPDYAHIDLFRPYIGLEFGAYYLAEQLSLFEQNVVASLAAYNAGPGRAANWLALAGEDLEVFLSAITIDSTRQYIQRIYSHYAVYRELYGKE